MGYSHGLEASMNAGIDLSIGDFVFEFDSCFMDFDPDVIMQVYRKSLQGFDIVIDKKCVNFIREISQYAWEKDKFGNIMAKPVDANQHLIDGMRYSVESDMLGAEVRAGKRF